MKKRFKFKCWNCEKNYTLHRKVTKDMTLFVACPYCEKEAIVDLKPFRMEKKDILRSENGDEKSIGMEFQLPEILPTTEIEQESDSEE